VARACGVATVMYTAEAWWPGETKQCLKARCRNQRTPTRLQETATLSRGPPRPRPLSEPSCEVLQVGDKETAATRRVWELCNLPPGTDVVYTDGSKVEGSLGWAAVTYVCPALKHPSCGTWSGEQGSRSSGARNTPELGATRPRTRQ